MEEAITNYQGAIQLSPKLTQAYLCLAIALSETNRKEEAMRQYQKVIEIDPNSADAYNGIGYEMNNLNR